MVLTCRSEWINLIIDKLACIDCRSSRLKLDELSGELRCQDCDGIFKIVNNIPSFVAAELMHCSEVPLLEREKFLEMKKTAYSGGSFVGRMYNHYHRYAAQKRIELSEKRLTVDIGFGVGEHYPFITEKEKVAGAFIGVDLDRFKLEHFCSLHPDIPVLQASAFRLPFAADSVAVVQLLATLEHFPPDEITGLLDEALRILQPWGALIVCYPAEGGLLLGLCQRVMHAYLKRRTGFDLDQGAIHRHLTGAGEIRAILGGRKELERQESSFYPFWIRSVNLSLFVNEIYRKR